jgi:CDP-ribitol ribitolphosphotransferase
VQATGVPRTDIFFDEKYIAETKESIYEEYPMLREKKVILFAPTYRGLRAEDAAYNFDMLDPDRLYEALGDDYVFVLKWHPATYNNLKREEKSVYHLEKYNNFFLDLSQERDINDLLLVADVMITDYSSVIFDYFLCHKPIIYYTFDLEEYEGGRGIYYDFEEYVYGPVARDLDTLIADIKEAKVDEDSRRAFNEKFMAACDGHATERTCAWLFDDVLPEDFVPAESPAKEDK